MVPPWLEQTLGALLALFIFIDVFLTVLYARIGAGILSYRIARWIWLILQHVSTRFSRYPGGPLSFCGPAILVAVVGAWALTLAFAMGLIIHPRPGTAVIATNGAPQTSAFRLFYLMNSPVGISARPPSLIKSMRLTRRAVIPSQSSGGRSFGRDCIHRGRGAGS